MQIARYLSVLLGMQASYSWLDVRILCGFTRLLLQLCDEGVTTLFCGFLSATKLVTPSSRIRSAKDVLQGVLTEYSVVQLCMSRAII